VEGSRGKIGILESSGGIFGNIECVEGLCVKRYRYWCNLKED
jgi:hypothetical protein